METVLRDAGSCGRYHVFHLVLTQLPRLFSLWGMFLMVLGRFDPGWRCSENRLPFGNGSEEMLYTRPMVIQNSTSNTEDRINSREDRDDVQVFIVRDTANTTFNGTCDEYKSCLKIEFDPSSRTVVSEFELICDRSWIVQCILICTSMGYLTGSILGGYVGERFGRKVGLYLFTLVMCVSSGVAILSTHWEMYAVCSFVSCLGGNGVISVVNVYNLEFFNSKWRGYVASIPIGMLSTLLLSLTAGLLKNWVHVHAITSGMGLLSCVGFFVLTESPRWVLMHKGRDKAEHAVNLIARMNRKPPPSFDPLDNIKSTQVSDKNERRNKHSYIDLFRIPQLRCNSVKLYISTLIYGMTYLALGMGISSLPGHFYTNYIVSSTCDIIAVILAGPLSNRIGRRFAQVIVTSLGIISCISIVVTTLITDGDDDDDDDGDMMMTRSTVIKMSSFVAKAASCGVWVISLLIFVELYPTVVRNMAVGLARCFFGVGTLLSPFLIPAKDGASIVVCYCILCAGFVVELVVFQSLPETNRLDLQDAVRDQNVSILPVNGTENKPVGNDGIGT